MPTIDANGLATGYDVDGAGPPLILLHGATSDAARDFRRLLPSLRQAFRCYLPDARGHGRTALGHGAPAASRPTGWPTTCWPSPTRSASTRSICSGSRSGAMTALRVAVRNPERLRTLVVVGITTDREPRASVARRLMDPVRIDRADPAWAADLARRHDPVQGEGAWRALLPAIARGRGHADRCSRRARSARSTRRRWSRPAIATRSCRSTMAWRLSRSVRDGRLLVLPDAGHEAFAERPAIATEALGDFYRSTEAVARTRAGDDQPRR